MKRHPRSLASDRELGLGHGTARLIETPSRKARIITKSSLGFGAYELFQLMRDGVPRTRAELTSLTGMARSTIGLRIDTLRELGLLMPVSVAASTGGRPSARIAFNPNARVVLAADIGATHTSIAITDLVGSVLAEVSSEVPIGNDPELDVPGTIQRHFPVPVLVDNDVNVMALGERATRIPEAENMVFVKVATGIGSGIISDGQLQRGADGTAGDIGHIAVARGHAVQCRCGNTGCLEAVAGGPAITAALRAAGLPVNDLADVVALARDGDHIREVVYARSMPLATQHLTIELSHSGKKAGIAGASILAIEHALSPERLEAISSTAGELQRV